MRAGSERAGDLGRAAAAFEETLAMRPGDAEARTWGIGAAVASLLLALGLVLRRREEGPAQLAGTLVAPISGVLLLALVPLALCAADAEATTRAGVLVAREAFLADETGRAIGGDPVPEATLVEVGERRGAMLQVRYGTREGWLSAATVRVLRVR